MYPTKNSEFFQITQQDYSNKFYSRILSKEDSSSNSSFRIYYGSASGAVPFLWESKPGIPKNKIATNTFLPPLTPPPSYNSYPRKKKNTKQRFNSILHFFLSRVFWSPPLPPPSSSSSVVSFGSSDLHRRERSSSLHSSFSDDELGEEGSPTSTLCWRVKG